jgi:hypothetical protein
VIEQILTLKLQELPQPCKSDSYNEDRVERRASEEELEALYAACVIDVFETNAYQGNKKLCKNRLS